jgi:hypothetical protein
VISPPIHGAMFVNLNVGGTHYEVSRTVLESQPESMLASLVSDRWNNHGDETTGNNEAKAIKVDRNGFRFQFVLDYLRDGTVSLPLTVSKDALLLDFAYFGISVDQTKIRGPGTLAEICDGDRLAMEDAKCRKLAYHIAAHYLCCGTFKADDHFATQKDVSDILGFLRDERTARHLNRFGLQVDQKSRITKIVT